jgi:branched-chain amino acid aminotransferase
MINFNGTIVSQDTNILTQNRAFFIWRCRFETVKIVNSKIFFRRSLFQINVIHVVRMEIHEFTMEYFEEQLLSLAADNDFQTHLCQNYCFRNDGVLFASN